MNVLTFLLAMASTGPLMHVECTEHKVPSPYMDGHTVTRSICRMSDNEKQIVCYWIVGAKVEQLVCIPSR